MSNNTNSVRCPICGSIELDKQGIAYKCTQCKTKFTIEQYGDEYEEED